MQWHPLTDSNGDERHPINSLKNSLQKSSDKAMQWL